MKKMSVSLSGHQTSISLEQEFITELQKIATADNRPVAAIISEIDATRDRTGNLSSAVRIYVLRRVMKN